MSLARAIEDVFHDCFIASHNTRLSGGADEPVYRPARAGTGAVICYREDFAASALHEVAHWCIAGPRRRTLEDYGYWYVPDGRNAAQQAAFERVELRPQALEWHFSLAAGAGFRVSVDNLAQSIVPADRFHGAVARQARQFCRDPLPSRAARFRAALAAALGGIAAPTAALFD